jgi:hypothetical protein
MMNKFKWGNADDPSVYLDENNRRMFNNFRRLFGDLGKSLLQAGDSVKAIEVAIRGLEIVPFTKLPDDYFSIGLAEVLVKAGKKEEGEKVFNRIADYSKDYLEYLVTVKNTDRYDLDYSLRLNWQSLSDIYYLADELGIPSVKETAQTLLNNYYSKLNQWLR